jgi:orotidine-5'-phosphate decarboxylase
MFMLPFGHFFKNMNELPGLVPEESIQTPKSEFVKKLEAQWSKGNFICIGLDSAYNRLPESLRSGRSVDEAIFDFNKEIVDATQGLVASYKPNTAFYEAEGDDGLWALYKTVRYIKESYPEIPVILDAKRGDIGNTNNGYVKSVFDTYHADAVTVNPYLGREALQPFLDRRDKGIFILAKTSNPGASEFQDKIITDEDGLMLPLYQYVARQVINEWNTNGNCGLVVGATYPEELAGIRQIAPNIPLLIPGIGAQGGQIESTVKAGKDSKNQGMIINASRSIIFASNGEDFAEAARAETQRLTDEINQFRLSE